MDLRFFEIYRNSEYLLLLLQGTMLSIAITVAGAFLGFIMALGLAGSRYARIPVAGHLSAAYVEFVRNTPLIVQLFFVAFGLPLLLGYQWPFWGHAILALTLNFSAYFSEILRAGLASVEEGQIEASQALGISGVKRFFLIVLPQAIARMYASLSSQFIFLFLTTGIISEVGVRDLTNAGVFIDSRTFRSFEVFLTLTLIYILVSLFFKSVLALIQRYAFPWVRAQ
jgi:polar amino acid transport system permease protein